MNLGHSDMRPAHDYYITGASYRNIPTGESYGLTGYPVWHQKKKILESEQPTSECQNCSQVHGNVQK